MKTREEYEAELKRLGAVVPALKGVELYTDRSQPDMLVGHVDLTAPFYVHIGESVSVMNERVVKSLNDLIELLQSSKEALENDKLANKN